MPMHREGFSEFLHQRRTALGKRWKRILSDAYLSRATLHRIRHGDPYHPIAEVDSLRSLSHALGFASWAELMKAFEAGNPRAGLGEQTGFSEDDMHRWHVEFEKSAPAEHQEFLEFLHIPSAKIQRIREWSGQGVQGR